MAMMDNFWQLCFLESVATLVSCHGSKTVLPDVSHRPSFVIMLVSAAVASQGCLWKMMTSDSWLTIRKGSFKELHNTTDLAEEKLSEGFEFFGPGDIHLFPVSVKTKFTLGLKENIAEGAETCVFKATEGIGNVIDEI
ncbi:hypothetical protein Tco_0899153 [Tanacetum coccineum]